MRAGCFVKNSIASHADHAHPQINLFRAAALMNQSAMVHKLPPAGGRFIRRDSFR
jgi:hypothetical protein